MLAFAPALWAEDPPKDKPKEEKKPTTPAEQYKALVQEFTKAQQDFFKEYGTLKTDEERRKLVQEKYPQPAKFAPKMMELAEKNPKDPAAIDALVWVVTSARVG